MKNIYEFRELRTTSKHPSVRRVTVNGLIEEAWKELAKLIGKTVEDTQTCFVFRAKNPNKWRGSRSHIPLEE